MITPYLYFPRFASGTKPEAEMTFLPHPAARGNENLKCQVQTKSAIHLIYFIQRVYVWFDPISNPSIQILDIEQHPHFNIPPASSSGTQWHPRASAPQLSWMTRGPKPRAARENTREPPSLADRLPQKRKPRSPVHPLWTASTQKNSPE